MKFIRILAAVLLLPAVFLVFLGCGGGETSPSATTTAPATSSPSATASTTVPTPTMTASPIASPSITSTPALTSTPAASTPPPTTPPPSTEPHVTTTVPPETQETVPPPTETPAPVFVLESSSFLFGELIPFIHSLRGANKSPELSWSGVPEGTASFAIIVDDPDSPGGGWCHWIIFNIPADTLGLAEGIDRSYQWPDGSIMQGVNDFGRIGYDGPDPPSGTHRYYFRIYALDTALDLYPGATRAQVVQTMEGHILAFAEYMGIYSVS